jgi:hypothetical protein
MALAITKPVTFTADTGSGPTYNVPTFAPAADSGIIVGVFISATGTPAKPTINTPSWLSGAWTEEADNSGGSSNRLTVWSGKAISSPSSAVISITGTSPTGCCIIVVQVTGQDPTDFVLQPENGALGSVASTTQQLNSALAGTDSAHLMFLGHNTNEVQNPTGGETELDDQGHNAPTRRFSAQYEINDRDSSMSWSTASSAVYALMEIKAAPTATPKSGTDTSTGIEDFGISYSLQESGVGVEDIARAYLIEELAAGSDASSLAGPPTTFVPQIVIVT